MKAILLLIPLQLFVSSCKERPVTHDLGNGFSISGMKSRGIFTISRNGSKVARIDLNDDHLVYSAEKAGLVASGQLSTPLQDSAGPGCSAFIGFIGPDGKQELHQVMERRILGGDPNKDDVLIGGAVYHFKKEAEQVVTPNGP
jgi:hypothetical protein